jgi:cytochrome c
MFRALLLSAAVAFLPGIAQAAGDFDEDAARRLAKKSGCLKCHAIDKKKDAPPYKEIAAKYKGKADAEDKLYKHATTNPEVEETAKKLKGKPDAEEELYKHLTTNPKVKVDGKEERHKSPKTKDEKEIRNLIRWILSLG